MKKSKKDTLISIDYAVVFPYMLIILLFIFVGYLYNKCAILEDEIMANRKIRTAQYGNLYNKYSALQDEVIAGHKIYVYDLEKILTKTDIVKTKQEFEENLIKLNNELIAGQKRIKSLHDAKIKEDFSEIYLSSLRTKRDELVTDYDEKLDELADKINRALAEICTEKNIPTVFLNNTVAITTGDVIDVTDEVLEKINDMK